MAEGLLGALDISIQLFQIVKLTGNRHGRFILYREEKNSKRRTLFLRKNEAATKMAGELRTYVLICTTAIR